MTFDQFEVVLTVPPDNELELKKREFLESFKELEFSDERKDAVKKYLEEVLRIKYLDRPVTEQLKYEMNLTAFSVWELVLKEFGEFYDTPESFKLVFKFEDGCFKVTPNG